MRIRYHTWRISVYLCAVFIAISAAGCVNGGNGMYEAAGDGDLPLEQRQPIEDYIDTVVPAYGAFMNELATEVGEQLYVSEHSTLYCMGLNTPERFDLYTANTFLPQGLPVDRVRHIGDKHFLPLGLDHVSTHSGDGFTSIYWKDRENGGWVVISMGKYVAADAVSGVRPGSLTEDQCVTFTSEWEKHLPMDTVFFDSLQSNTQSGQQSGQTAQSSNPPQSGR